MIGYLEETKNVTLTEHRTEARMDLGSKNKVAIITGAGNTTGELLASYPVINMVSFSGFFHPHLLFL
jgi:acyl-CoA reductase-like NAD-dependent aldehyde dehydrogenase